MRSSTAEQTLGKTILLIEDEAPTRNVVARHLRNRGYDVTPVESAEDALTEVDRRDGPFDVVISDVHLPGVSGIDLASVLLMRNPIQPIVLVTGDPDEALARDALSRGPVSYLLKPFELFELEAQVQQAIMRSQPAPAPRPRKVDEHQETDNTAVLEEWLQFVDEHSYAGVGHADRVARMATVLLSCLPEAALEITAADIVFAARTHEIGRLNGPADPTEMAVQGAQLLRETDFPDVVVKAVRHLHERWDGTGGPDGLAGSAIPAGSLVLAAADSIDHYCSAWMQAGMKPLDAVDRAIGLVVVQQSTLFSPLVAGAVHRQRPAIREICTAARPDAAARRASASEEDSRGLRLA